MFLAVCIHAIGHARRVCLSFNSQASQYAKNYVDINRNFTIFALQNSEDYNNFKAWQIINQPLKEFAQTMCVDLETVTSTNLREV